MMRIAQFTLVFLCCVLSACSQNKNQSPLIGKWTINGGAGREPVMLTFLSNGKFRLNYGQDSREDIWGKFSISDDIVSIVYSAADTDSDTAECATPGKYAFRVNGETLKFIMVNDGCATRKANLSYYYQNSGHAED